MIDQYYQCKLERSVPGSSHITQNCTVWIAARGAAVGRRVELLPDHEFWTVVEVYTHGLPEDVLKTHQQLNRKSLLSVEPMGAPPKQVGGL